ncbi:hypothetical protein [Psychromonas aquimarina]|uniref:hypothetical protein n=1 Tax=Psychromonas aquimarina TaxID=444919 RepID=UPI0003F7DC5A|nr:hypothetical protein [Psychromonas aquimarina]
MFKKISPVVLLSLSAALSGCDSESTPPAEIQPPVQLPENDGDVTPGIPLPPKEEVPAIWPQELLEIEAYYGIPAQDSWALCTAEEVSCYWNSETSTFQWVWSGLEGKYEGDLIDILFYLDPLTEMQGYPQMTAKLSNESLNDPVDHEKFQKAKFTWYRCSADQSSCELPWRVVSFQDSEIADNSYITTDYQDYEEQMTVKAMRDTAVHENATFSIEQKYQQRGEGYRTMVLLFDKGDERKEKLFTLSADVLTHIYE